MWSVRRRRRTEYQSMEIIGAVLIGVTIGVLAGLRVIRSLLSIALVIASVIAIFGFMAVRSGGLQTTADLGRVLAVIYVYGLGFLFFMALPGTVAFGFVTLIRRACVPAPPKLQRSARKLRFTFLGALCFGLFYLLYSVGLLVTSPGIDTGIVLRGAGPNEPMLLLMVMFGFEESIKGVPWLESAYFTAVGAVLYAAFGGVAGYVLDLLRPSHEHAV